jgi:phosphoribosylanthranilate isomerase
MDQAMFTPSLVESSNTWGQPSRTRVKICGITREEDLRTALLAGADALGFVLYPRSPRYVKPELALRLAAKMPSFVTPVFLFVNEQAAQIQSLHKRCPRALMQLHGDEDSAFCEGLGLTYVRALRISNAQLMDEPGINDARLLQSMQAFPSAQGYLLDAHVDTYGGGGQIFDWKKFNWSNVQTHAKAALVLGGGLSPANVAEAIRRVRPWAVDVSSGVEQSKGIKDPEKIKAFMAAVRQADDALAGLQP